jgi:tetratricopeptide (TPR) repeat protein
MPNAAEEPVGSAEVRWRVQGRFLEIEVALDSGPFSRALYTLGFDTRHQEYQVLLMDDSGTYFVTARGAAPEEGSPVVMYGKDEDPVMTALGFEKEFALVVDFLSEDRFAIETRFIDTRTAARNELPFLYLSFQRPLAADPGAETVGPTVGGLARTDLQAFSLFGEPLYSMFDTAGAVEEADRALALAPDDVELIIAAGRVRRNFWQYRQAMALYSRAIELSPTDWRPYRFRGHRHISLREFDEAIEDLERARGLAPLNWDVAYHLGLAYFLAGRFSDASDEYIRCLGLADAPGARAAQAEDFRSCSQNSADSDSWVAMTEWAVRAALRAGREEVAAELLSGVPNGLNVGENLPYYHDLLFYKGEMTAEELLDPGPDAPYRLETVGYGVANWLIAQGDTVQATHLLRELVKDEWWPGFGRICAEVELFRLTR